MNRREFITLLGGAAAAWPLIARAQQPERMRRIGVLSSLAADDRQSQRRMTAFVQGLQQFGWTDGRNVTLETRWGAGDSERLRRYAVHGAIATGNPLGADRVRAGHRRRRCWIRRKSVTTGRQCDRLFPVRIRLQRKMA